MEALQRQEEQLKDKLEDAATIVERRQLRAELRELRNKIANFNLKDENANDIAPKKDLNSNTILPKKDLNANIETKTSTKIIDSESKYSRDSSISNGKKKDPEYRVTDDTENLRVKSADERASRRAKRQERMAKLTKEQNEDESKKETTSVISSRNKVEETRPTVVEKKTNVEDMKSSAYGSKKKVEDTKISVYDSKSKVEDTKGSMHSKWNKIDDADNEGKKMNANGFDARRQRSYIKDEKPKEIDSPKAAPIVERKFEERPFSRNSTLSKPETRYEKKDEFSTRSAVNMPKSFISKTERKEERTMAVDVGGRKEEIKHTVQDKSVIQNGEQTTHTTRTTTSRTNPLDRFKSIEADKKKAAGTIGKALSVSSARERFASAEKSAPSKPMDLGLNFTKKSDKPGYTVKKFSEIKVEEKTTMKGPSEFGLSFLQKKDQAPARSNLRETGPGSMFKKTTPSPHPRHQTAPAAPTSQPSFSMPGGGSKSSSVADRMAMFRQAQEDEKARIAKQKAKEDAQRQRIASDPSPVKSPTSTTAPCVKKREVKKPIKRTMSISNIVLDWCREMVKDYGIEIKNFSGSWSSGLAFCALIHKFNPDSFDFNELNEQNREKNFQLAFDTAFEVKKIPKLLDVEDMVRMAKPEPRSVQCYVQWIWSVYGPTSGYGPSMEEIKQATVG